jgi:Protein of unknown function (DUF3617)
MKTKILATAVLVFAVSACGGGAKDEGKDEKAAASASSGPVKREAGNWKTDIKIVKIAAPGMPAGMEAQMQKSMPQGTEMCLTKEQADKEDLAQEMSKSGNTGDCTFSKKELNGGNMNVEGSCKTPQGQMNIAMTGMIEPKKTDITMNIKGKSPTGNGDMEMVMQMTSTNIGPCKTS